MRYLVVYSVEQDYEANNKTEAIKKIKFEFPELGAINEEDFEVEVIEDELD